MNHLRSLVRDLASLFRTQLTPPLLLAIVGTVVLVSIAFMLAGSRGGL